MIDCGYYHTICLDYDGNVFSFGSNEQEKVKQTKLLQKINILPCKQVSCGNEFIMCLTKDNRLFSFGNNSYGQLGLENVNNYSSPQLIPYLNNIEYVICGGEYVICKLYNNTIFSWGNNEYGQLGQGHNISCYKPMECSNWPDDIIDIKCGDCHTLILTDEKKIYSFGNNYMGKLGINDENITSINKPILITDIPEIQRIECGSHHSMCIDINDNLWLFGYNNCGQLGLEDTEECRYKPIIHPTLSNIIDISSRGFHTFVKTSDNKIYAFGYNNHSQLGIETSTNNQLTPIQVLIGNEDIWMTRLGKSKQKSARK